MKETLKFYQKYKIIIFPTIVAFCSLILLMVIILPQTIKLLDNQSLEKDILKKSEFLEAKAQTLASYDTQDLSSKVNYALNSFPSDKDFATAVGVIQDLTGKLGFTISSLTLAPDSALEDTDTESYGINLSLSGSIGSLQDLLNGIESSHRLMRVRSVESSVKNEENVTTVFLTIAVLFSPTSSSLNPDAPLPDLSQTDQEVLAQLAQISPPVSISAPSPVGPSSPSQLPARGKPNPFE